MVVEPPMEAAFFKILLTDWTHNKNPKSSQVETTKGFGCFRYER